ncbi:signal recognition particle 14 kDa protein isoform X2 [Theropithecus gelada]|uniref:signal recognition particle 14 kDa protein isoform X2 n=1 Tax=Theropithecus gelada TaxID=9565 RepID=UPI000DC1ACC1|nr:signal recognition particle 14 kDa protein isoform X2 [Theropithecus gelada]
MGKRRSALWENTQCHLSKGFQEVSSKEVNKFQMAYSNLLRANMDGLKKRDKKNKTKKTKAAAAAAAAAVAAAAAPAAAATPATPATPAATAATAAQ